MAEYDLRTEKNLRKPFLPLAKAADIRTLVVRVKDDKVMLDL
jgi:hypothetical protein